MWASQKIAVVSSQHTLREGKVSEIVRIEHKHLSFVLTPTGNCLTRQQTMPNLAFSECTHDDFLDIDVGLPVLEQFFSLCASSWRRNYHFFSLCLRVQAFLEANNKNSRSVEEFATEITKTLTITSSGYQYFSLCMRAIFGKAAPVRAFKRFCTIVLTLFGNQEQKTSPLEQKPSLFG